MTYDGKWSKTQKKPEYDGVQYVAMDVPKMYEEEEKAAVIRASLKSVDKVARDMEQRWGIGKLEQLANPALATRFEQARQNLNHALGQESISEVVAKAEDMIRGWRIIEKKVLEAGHKPECEKVWHMVNDEGKKYAFVNDSSDHVYFDKDITVISMEEVLRIIEAHYKELYVDIKSSFPSAEITKITKKDKLDDELPF
tara:strand:+ start:1031 stop:1624 length:594 start_codon:yes stop_codon:yes gene_type:complete